MKIFAFAGSDSEEPCGGYGIEFGVVVADNLTEAKLLFYGEEIKSDDEWANVKEIKTLQKGVQFKGSYYE